MRGAWTPSWTQSSRQKSGRMEMLQSACLPLRRSVPSLVESSHSILHTQQVRNLQAWKTYRYVESVSNLKSIGHGQGNHSKEWCLQGDSFPFLRREVALRELYCLQNHTEALLLGSFNWQCVFVAV